MIVSTKGFREATKQWLEEEKATVEQALKLLSALEAGAVDGGTYKGKRDYDNERPREVLVFRSQPGNDSRGEARVEARGCGCLVDTLERIKGYRPHRSISGATEEAFSLALMIGLGDTPKNSKWARAAAKGIEDYLATKEVGV